MKSYYDIYIYYYYIYSTQTNARPLLVPGLGTIQPHMGTAVTNRIRHANNRISMSLHLFQLIFERVVALTEHTLRIMEDN